MKPIIILRSMIFVTAALAANEASANWQFTKWGMTPKQVEAASHGKAREATVADRGNEDSTPIKTLLAMPYNSGNLSFTATFGFQGGHLARIILSPAPDTNQFTLIEALKAKYGQPSDSSRDPLSTSTSWNVGEDRVKYLEIGGSTGDVIYTPRTSTDNQGL